MVSARRKYASPNWDATRFPEKWASPFGIPQLITALNILLNNERFISVIARRRRKLTPISIYVHKFSPLNVRTYLGSCMIDMGLSSNNMNSPAFKCYMAFWDIIIYRNTLHWWVTSLNMTLLPNWTLLMFLTLLPYAGRFNFIMTFATSASSQQRTLTSPDTWSCPFGSYIFVIMLREKGRDLT